MSRFRATDLPLAGLKLVERRRIEDQRGSLARIFCSDELKTVGWEQPLAQINLSCTRKRGTVRGMHFQMPPHAEMKLVSCTQGEIWDVALDLRSGSKTFLQWHAQLLSGDNGRAMLIPEGFAHGFQTMTDDVEMVYCHSCSYVASADAGLNPQDANLGIHWPLAITDISAKDSSRSALEKCFRGVSV